MDTQARLRKFLEDLAQVPHLGLDIGDLQRPEIYTLLDGLEADIRDAEALKWAKTLQILTLRLTQGGDYAN